MLTALVPCLNEAEGLARLESALYGALEPLGTEFEVLLVDDGSTDDTQARIQEIQTRRSNLRLITHEGNQGIGASLKSGIREARGDWLVFLDADLTFHPDLIPLLIAKQKETGADCVSGSPVLGGMPGVPFMRRLPSLLMNTFYRGFLDRRLTAFTPMFRLYRTADLKALTINSDGFEVSVEILARLLRAGKTIAEIPAPLSTRQTGASKLQRCRELRSHARLALKLFLNA